MLYDAQVYFTARLRVYNAQRNSQLSRIISEHNNRMTERNRMNEHVKAEQRVRDNKEESAYGAAELGPGPLGVGLWE